MESKWAELRLTPEMHSSLARVKQGIPLSKPSIYREVGCPSLYHIEYNSNTVVP